MKPAVPPTLVLAGPPGEALDRLVYVAINGGLTVERATKGYRVNGTPEQLDELRVLAAFAGPYFLEVDQPSDAVELDSALVLDRPFPRQTTVGVPVAHAAVVARAIDHRLIVRPVGVGRFAVSGLTSKQIAWMVAALGLTAEQVRSNLNLTEEDVAAEDQAARSGTRLEVSIAQQPQPATVDIIERDDSGRIARVVVGRDEPIKEPLQ